jgi:protein SCO1/2
LTQPAPSPSGRALDGGFWLVLILAAGLIVLAIAAGLRGMASTAADGGSGGAPGASAPAVGAATASAAPSVDAASFLYPTVRDAPGIALTDPDGQSLSLASMRGGIVLVLFGYTHCPDVCPATIGVAEQAMSTFGAGIRTLFVTVDPERDTTAWLKEFDGYRAASFTALTGSAAQIRATADAWNVRYARVETGVPGAYSMSHTADVFAVDSAGRLRAHFPFGTTAPEIEATLRLIASSAALPAPSVAPPAATASANASATASVPTGGGLQVEVDSSSIWAGSSTPLILALSGPAGRLNDMSVQPIVELSGSDGAPVGSPVTAIPVQPPGLATVSYAATVTIPSPGWWHLAVSVTPGAMTLTGTADIAALDPGTSAPIGSAAPAIHSPTLTDVNGDVRRISTDPIPDLRLYGQSTGDLLAQHQAFVLVLDSAKFRVTSACGKALIMARYLQDRWPAVPFVHVEPFRYDVVTDTPVLEGSLADPTLNDVASVWGIGGDPWGPTSMPWVFVVDGHGIVRAKYQGVMGSEDVDVLVALLEQGG